MKSNRILVALAGLMLTFAPSASHALPLVTSLTEHGTGLNANAAIVTSASNPSGPAGGSQSAALVDESFAYVTRNAEWTAVRTNDTTFALTNAAVSAGVVTQEPFPSYLVGLEYIQLAMENRTITDYSIDAGFSVPVKAYLFVDNRLDGTAGDNGNGNNNEPDLGGNLSWIVSDGWARVNTGFMPNGRPDYIGMDEGGNAANAGARVHPTTVGTGEGLNNYSAIFSKSFAQGLQVGFIKQQGINNGNFFGIAVAADGPPLVLGDTNGNNIGGEYPVDFNPIRDNFRKSPRVRADGDLTGNGVVDFADFQEWKAAALGSGASLEGLDLSFLASVPEPGSGLLALMAGTVIVAVRSRRRESASRTMKG